MERNCTSKTVVDALIEKVEKAFEALRRPLFSSTRVSYRIKALVYVTLILTILLYAVEC